MKNLLKVFFDLKILATTLVIIFLTLYISGEITGFPGISKNLKWEHFPFLTGIVSGVITLAFSFFIFENWRQKRTDQLWEEVAKVTYKDLSRTCRDIVATIQILYICVKQLPHEYDRAYLDPWSLNLFERVNRSQRQLHAPILDATHHIMIENPHRHFSKERCEHLYQNQDWRKWAIVQVDLLWTQHCDVVAKWAPLMMHSSQSRKFLNEFSKFDHEFRRIYFKLSDSDSFKVENLWNDITLLDLSARALYNDLREAANPDPVNRPDLFHLCTTRQKKSNEDLRNIAAHDKLQEYCALLS